MTTPTPKDNPPFDPPVFCSGIERDCKHGQLARSCNICELERDLAAREAELAAERRRREEVREECGIWKQRAEAAERALNQPVLMSEWQELQADRDEWKRKAERYESRLFSIGAMEEAPCFKCGYNGAGYYQQSTHPCAALHHAAIAAKGEA